MRARVSPIGAQAVCAYGARHSNPVRERGYPVREREQWAQPPTVQSPRSRTVEHPCAHGIFPCANGVPKKTPFAQWIVFCSRTNKKTKPCVQDSKKNRTRKVRVREYSRARMGLTLVPDQKRSDIACVPVVLASAGQWLVQQDAYGWQDLEE